MGQSILKFSALRVIPSWQLKSLRHTLLQTYPQGKDMVKWSNIHMLLKYTIAMTVFDKYEDYLKEMNINILDSFENLVENGAFAYQK